MDGPARLDHSEQAEEGAEMGAWAHGWGPWLKKGRGAGSPQSCPPAPPAPRPGWHFCQGLGVRGASSRLFLPVPKSSLDLPLLGRRGGEKGRDLESRTWGPQPGKGPQRSPPIPAGELVGAKGGPCSRARHQGCLRSSPPGPGPAGRLASRRTAPRGRRSPSPAARPPPRPPPGDSRSRGARGPGPPPPC